MYTSVFRPGLFAGQTVVVTGGGIAASHTRWVAGLFVAIQARHWRNCADISSPLWQPPPRTPRGGRGLPPGGGGT